MRGTKARRIRKTVYGEKDFRERRYYRTTEGAIASDELRFKYQQTKRVCTEGARGI